MGLFDGEIVEGSPDWINQEWERMERENPTQTIRRIVPKTMLDVRPLTARSSIEYVSQEQDPQYQFESHVRQEFLEPIPIPRAKIITDHSILQRLLRLEAEMKRKRTQTRGEELE